jgi:hypothetical protein
MPASMAKRAGLVLNVEVYGVLGRLLAGGSSAGA